MTTRQHGCIQFTYNNEQCPRRIVGASAVVFGTRNQEAAMPRDTDWPPLPPVQTGVRGKCRRCGKGHLFKGFLTLREKCEVCGLHYSFADPADGAAFFVICFGCVPAVALAVWIEVAFWPPRWVHLFTSLPFLPLTCIPPLRPLKGWLVAGQFFFKAGEGRIANQARNRRARFVLAMQERRRSTASARCDGPSACAVFPRKH